MTHRYLFVRADGWTAPLDREKPMDLATMQEFVDGPIEVIPALDPDRVVIANEDGNPRGLPPNFVATAAAGRPIVGDVLIVDRETFYNDEETNDV